MKSLFAIALSNYGSDSAMRLYKHKKSFSLVLLGLQLKA